MPIWNDKWVCEVHVKDGWAEGNRYYFATKEEAEKFRRSIATEPDVKACYVHENEDYEK
jgi:hypothetical protein